MLGLLQLRAMRADIFSTLSPGLTNEQCGSRGVLIAACSETSPQELRRCHGRNYSWVELVRRVFALDVLECPTCGGRMPILPAIYRPEAVQEILECFGLRSAATDCLRVTGRRYG